MGPNKSSSPAGEITWRWCHFEQLGVHELQNIYAARQQVFTLEQQCLYLDADGVDERSWHLAAWSTVQREPLAYARVVEPGVKYTEPSIGRVITTAAARSTGLGRELVARAITQCQGVFMGHGIRISAQSHLEAFYGGFGFQIIGERYMEDGIPHTEMLLPPAN